MEKNLGVFVLLSLLCVGYGSTMGGGSSCEQVTAGSDYISMLNSHLNMTYRGKAVNYPNNYRRCWLITAELSGRVQVRSESFKLQAPDSNDMCKDWVKVYDGKHENPDRLVATYCGHQKSLEVVSTGHHLLMVFNTDNSVTDEGFWIEHHAVNWKIPSRDSGPSMAAIGIVVMLSVVIFITVSIIAIVFVLCKKYHLKKQERKKRMQDPWFCYDNDPAVMGSPLPLKA